MNKTSSSEIWLVVDSRQFGGIETHVVQLAHGLTQQQQVVKVLLISRYSSPSPICDKLKRLGIEFDYLGHNHSSALKQLVYLIREQSPLVVHAHGYRASIIAKLAKLITHNAQISTYHAGESPSGKMKIYDGLDRYSAFISDKSLVVSHAIANKIPTRSQYIKNFIDCHSVPFEHGQAIAFVGRFSTEKAPERFCRLAALFPLLQFDMYGSGPLEHAIIANAGSNVHCHGHQNDMSSIWPTISVLVICSDFEGLPMVALEAMARGIVVIASCVGELPSLIIDGENGWLAQDETALHQKLTQWQSLSESAQNAIRVNAANTIHQHYSQQVIIPKMLKLYQRISTQFDSQIAS
ncbi:hypothetical protein VII00023_08124 [Vibrio ichthyoenteri ATCC 700023]|uniref:Glycosyltransferase subfamily 4-like N-terminal domain-containing protein n=1 Tax=Vibrio ichthyoenteri ATCC 700023 TaxID=870968 RepID=F9RXR4_9VIBR|nr:glycosyltransferase family 4 protein [Vibrio ichthyoenteri]EGU47605.1 hypothetical protein VII00023_08124 [Vibrio ichthyoenteri ATCC 700023]